jgi:uncharacterized protein YhaN
MNDTPITDAARGFHDMDSAVDAEAMEKLEIEFNTCMGVVRLYKDLLRDYKELFEKTAQKSESVCDDNVRLARKLKEVKVDADALAAVIAKVSENLRDAVTHSQHVGDSYMAGTASELERALETYHNKYP